MLYNVFSDFFEKYYWNGIKYDTAYNWVDTLTYAVIFVGFIWLLYSKVFERKKIIVDRHFIFALVGWIIFGSSMRAAEDAEIFKTSLLVTPFFYVTIFAIAFPMLLVALKFNKKIPYWRSWGGAGYVLGALVLIQLPLKNAKGLLLSFGIWLLWIALFWILHKSKPKILSRWNFTALSAQMFDAASTFAALTFYPGFWEKHVLGSTLIAFFESRNLLLINGSASWVMFALKLAVVPFVLYAIDKYGETNNEKNFLKMIILMLGFAVGLRNTLEIGMT
jgi:uncharacterized membrane protein